MLSGVNLKPSWEMTLDWQGERPGSVGGGGAKRAAVCVSAEAH